VHHIMNDCWDVIDVLCLSSGIDGNQECMAHLF